MTKGGMQNLEECLKAKVLAAGLSEDKLPSLVASHISICQAKHTVAALQYLIDKDPALWERLKRFGVSLVGFFNNGFRIAIPLVIMIVTSIGFWIKHTQVQTLGLLKTLTEKKSKHIDSSNDIFSYHPQPQNRSYIYEFPKVRKRRNADTEIISSTSEESPSASQTRKGTLIHGRSRL